MELLAISLARTVAFMELQAWDPNGKATTLEAIQKLVESYTFRNVPQKFADIDFQRGLELQDGRFGEIAIDKISIFLSGIMVDTRSSTQDSERVVWDLVKIARSLFGATIDLQRIYFVSQLIFRSKLRLALLNPALEAIAPKISETVSADLKHPYNFETVGIIMNADLSQTKIAPGAFTLERRTDAPFEENTYFSNAPLRTNQHIALIEELERVLTSASESTPRSLHSRK